MLNVLFERFREVLRSREIFRNWLSAAIHYALINPRILYRRLPNLVGVSGKDCINVSCKNGGKICIDPALYAHVIRGFYLGLIRDVRCDERDNGLIVNGLIIKFKRIYGSIIEIFIYQDYSAVDVSGRIIVDVGGFVGDSAIYFVLRGARRVYAVEPHPGAYQEMLENIKLNNMQDKIIPINAALGSKPGKIRIPNIDVNTTRGTYYGPESNGSIEVPMITLKQLINDYGIEPDILKMNCEGCEFDAILNDYEHVRLFRELIFEYHEGNGRKLAELLGKLNNNYECKIIKSTNIKGIVHCMKLN